MGGGAALALGALLDGIPEQLVLGIGLADGDVVSAGLLAAIFVSNLPEAIGGANDMRKEGHERGKVAWSWVGIAALCTLATVAGYVAADAASDDLQGGINGFAAGALLVMRGHDDPRGAGTGRPHDRAGHRARLRRRGGAVVRLAPSAPADQEAECGTDQHRQRYHDDQRRLPGAEDPVHLDFVEVHRGERDAKPREPQRRDLAFLHGRSLSGQRTLAGAGRRASRRL